MKLNRRGKIQTHEIYTGPQTEEPQKTIIMFHGYGADCFDLAPLAQALDLSKSIHWIFPMGPVEVPIGPGWTGHAWWPIDMDKFMKNIEDRDMSLESPPTLPQLRKEVIEMIHTLKVPWSQIVLSGFSQGGMLAADIAFHAPSQPHSLMILSSGLINKQEWLKVAKSRSRLRFFQSHGRNDSVIHLKNAQRLESFLKEFGLDGSLFTFAGGHEIPQQVLEKMRHFLLQDSTFKDSL